MLSARRPSTPIKLLAAALLLALAGCGSSDQADQAEQTDQTDQTERTEVSAQGEEVVEEAGTIVRGSVDLAGGEIVTVRADAAGEGQVRTVLFLHGAAFTSETWVENGILEAVAAAGIDAVSIDLPGSGNSSSVDLDEEDVLGELFPALGLEPSTTVVVSPSMSGIFSLPALRQPGLADLGGYVPVAPSGAGSFAGDGDPVTVPALVVWGDGDGSDPQGSAESLAAGFVDAEILILADAGHAAYQQQPEAFATALVEFVNRAIK